jgi:hypothetical protein
MPTGKRNINAIWMFFKSAFDGKLALFKGEWDKLSDKDKDDIDAGITDGTLNY